MVRSLKLRMDIPSLTYGKLLESEKARAVIEELHLNPQKNPVDTVLSVDVTLKLKNEERLPYSRQHFEPFLDALGIYPSAIEERDRTDLQEALNIISDRALLMKEFREDRATQSKGEDICNMLGIIRRVVGRARLLPSS